MLQVVNLVSKSDKGHRRSVDLVLTRAFADAGVTLAPGRRDSAADFFAMLDDDIAGFIGASLANVMRGRKTVGLFFRPHQCFVPGRVKYALKRALFTVLRRLPGTTILSIVPFYANPKFSAVADDWIYDPQVWDLDYVDHATADRELGEAIVKAANGRHILVSLGLQNEEKGFNYLCRLWNERTDLRERFLFVSAGALGSTCDGIARTFSANGGYLVDRWISEPELFALYDVATVVWSCYDPAYDQASGIFGRSYQLNRRCAVRAGSYLQTQGEQLGHAIIALPYNDVDGGAAHLLAEADTIAPGTRPMRRDVSQLRQESLGKLLAALGFAS